jgi:uncharacterized protein YeaO (DUF488 family)
MTSGTNRAGDLRETYCAALQHDLVDLPDDASLIGVVREPTGWFHATVDENRPALGPPADLLDAFRTRHEDLKMQGLCDEGAHNAAWDDLDFAAAYRDHLRTDPAARAAVEDLTDRVESGESVVLVCYEGEKKRCHRRVLVDVLERSARGADRDAE